VPARTPPVLAVHGGAGNPRPELLHEARLARCRAGLAAALHAGHAVLTAGGAALDAVQAAVEVLEDDPEFNAGRGAVLTAAGTVETDATVVDGRDRRAGAVGSLVGIRHPVAAARAVLDDGAHVLLVGDGAVAFAGAAGLETAPPEWFVTPRRFEAHRQRARAGGSDPEGEDRVGTVGAVALDARGHLAAATSTGGTSGKAVGRVGDSALPGAGTWADDRTVAVSATGLGEVFVRTAFGHEVDALLRLGGLDLAAACDRALADVVALGGRGGCVAVDGAGRVALPFTTTTMYRGWIDGDGVAHVAIGHEREAAWAPGASDRDARDHEGDPG
jgi:isoaspartyl peptidase/L-asparaginase-like protein (Ntn-hydrolase superfamily)